MNKKSTQRKVKAVSNMMWFSQKCTEISWDFFNNETFIHVENIPTECKSVHFGNRNQNLWLKLPIHFQLSYLKRQPTDTIPSDNLSDISRGSITYLGLTIHSLHFIYYSCSNLSLRFSNCWIEDIFHKRGNLGSYDTKNDYFLFFLK